MMKGYTSSRRQASAAPPVKELPTRAAKQATKPSPKQSPKPKRDYDPEARVEESRKADSFPIISVLPKSEMTDARDLIELDQSYKQQIDELETARKEVKAQLHQIVERNELPGGMRWGQYVVYDNGMKRKRTLDQKKFQRNLVEAEVDVDVVEDCRERAYKSGEEYLDLKVLRLDATD